MTEDVEVETHRARVYVDMVGDLFHAGHVSLLREASRHGDWLIVGVLSDATVASYKRRPITTLAERVAVIEACRYVDQVIPNAPFELTEKFLDDYGIATVVHGNDLTPEGAEAVCGPAVTRGRFTYVQPTGGIFDDPADPAGARRSRIRQLGGSTRSVTGRGSNAGTGRL